MGNAEGAYEVTHRGQTHSLPQGHQCDLPNVENVENAATQEYPPPYGSPSQPARTSNSADVIDVEIRGDAPGG